MLESILFKIGVWNGWIFMSVFILQMIVITFADKHIRERSHVPKEARRTPLEKYIGIIANVVWFLALAYSVFLPLHIGTPWFIIGFVVFFLGVIFLSFSTINFMTTPMDQLIQKRCVQIFKASHVFGYFFDLSRNWNCYRLMDIYFVELNSYRVLIL